MEKKFECLKCGKCCKEFGTIKLSSNQNLRGFPIFEWERSRLITKAEENNFKLDITPLIEVHDVKTKTNLVLEYHLHLKEKEPCPFLKNNQCSIYDDRPLVCKSFPIFSLNPDCIMSSDCPKMKDLQIFKKYMCKRKMFEMFDENYFVALQKESIIKILIDLIKELEKEGYIKIAKQGDKIRTKKTKPFLWFCLINGILTKKMVDDLILHLEDYEYLNKLEGGNKK